MAPITNCWVAYSDTDGFPCTICSMHAFGSHGYVVESETKVFHKNFIPQHMIDNWSNTYMHFFLSFVESEKNSIDVPLSILFVGQLPSDMTESELMSLFPGCIGTRLIYDPFTGISKG